MGGDAEDPGAVDVDAIAKHLAQLDEAERQIHTESSDSIAQWLVLHYRLAMADASRIALRIQELLLTIGLG